MNTYFYAPESIATEVKSDGDLACRVRRDLYWPDERLDKNKKEYSRFPGKRLAAARLLCVHCVQCVRFDECLDEDLPRLNYGAVAGVDSGTTDRAKASETKATLALRTEYLESVALQFESETEPQEELIG